MIRVPDYTEDEHSIVRKTVDSRWKKDPVEIQLADAEVQLDYKIPEMTECPVLFWLAGGCSFVIMKCGENRYKCNFFYKELEQISTGIEECDDLQQCVTVLLQTQADYDSVRSGAYPEDSGLKT